MRRNKNASAVWARALQEIRNAPAPKTNKTRAELETEISEITELLKGPLDNITRLDLVEAKHIRNLQLAAAP